MKYDELDISNIKEVATCILFEDNIPPLIHSYKELKDAHIVQSNMALPEELMMPRLDPNNEITKKHLEADKDQLYKTTLLTPGFDSYRHAWVGNVCYTGCKNKLGIIHLPKLKTMSENLIYKTINLLKILEIGQIELLGGIVASKKFRIEDVLDNEFNKSYGFYFEENVYEKLLNVLSEELERRKNKSSGFGL